MFLVLMATQLRPSLGDGRELCDYFGGVGPLAAQRQNVVCGVLYRLSAVAVFDNSFR